ncbi:hypothetical protein V6N12_045398 [Hibiscus sabdariffa]|uniref:Integrase catalytic domain-containing protein n=1 Tax=Hibiscus sabdariffa TaxID=183260 RepID=A0ABR2G2N6_9ROSI
MRHKSEALEKFKEFRNEVQNQHGKSIKALRSDRGGEYLSHEFDELLKECGIVSQLTPPGTPQWNGVSERRNRTLLDTVRSMMSHSDLPISFWVMHLKHKEDRRNTELEEVQQQQEDTEPEVERFSQTVEENSSDLETRPLRRSTRERHEPERYGFLVTTHGDVILVDHDEPKTYQEAVSSPDSEKWLEAMRSEMDSMSDNQIHGIDYDETFSPVAMFKSIRILLAIAAFHDYEIWQMDVKTAFLNGKLEEDVYMTQPEGFVTPENAGKVYLSYALSMTSRYQANPGEGHWVAVKNILKYLRRTKDVFLVYGGEEQLSIKGYTDASFQTDKDDSRSQSGFVFRLNGASEAAKESVWIKKFITELGVVPSISDALELYCDNNGAIVQAKEPRSHQRSKHILRRFHLIREIVDRGDMEIYKVHTDDNIVDPLTKPLSQQKHDRHTESLGMPYRYDL